MSWEAVTWATKQRMKSSHEQLVLLVLANAADPDGVAFARWPGRDHWWKYLVDLTRLSKSTLFRDINTLIEVGLCTRSMIVRSDGTRRPTIQLDLEANFKFKKEDDAHSHTETGTDDDDAETENDHDINDKQDEFSGAEIYSHTETGATSGNEPDQAVPTGGNDPFPVVGMHKDTSTSVPKESPLPPSGGLCAFDEMFEEFVKAWGEPIPKMALTRSAWDRVPTEKRPEAVAAAKGYWAWLRGHPKPPSAQSAQSFLRDVASWEQWLRFVPSGQSNAATGFPPDSTEAKAIAALHEVAGRSEAFRKIWRRADGSVRFPKPVTQQLLALAKMPPSDEWLTLDRAGAGSWEDLLRQYFEPGIARTHLREGSHAPWRFAPSLTGKIYTADTGPPERMMTEADYADFK